MSISIGNVKYAVELWLTIDYNKISAKIFL